MLPSVIGRPGGFAWRKVSLASTKTMIEASEGRHLAAFSV